MEAPMGVLLSDDMMFTSRITGTARDLGLTLRTLRSMDGILQEARKLPPTCVIVDLANPTLNVPELISQLGKSCATMPYVVAYGSHVDAAGLRAARDAGCNLVLPRSKFVEDLPRELPVWFGATATPRSPEPAL